jgi:tetratricopeptide (TPR) repeat protein
VRALGRVHSARADWKSLIESLGAELALEGPSAAPETRSALLQQMGELHVELGDKQAALARFKDAFALQPQHRPTQAALERFLPTEAGLPAAARVDLARLLLPVFEQRGEHKRVAECLQILLDATPADDKTGRLQILRRLAAIIGEDDGARAYTLSTQVFEADPGDAENRRTLAGLADRLERPDDLAVRLTAAEENAERNGNKKLAVDLAWEIGQLFETRLGMPADAETAYKRVLGREPDHLDAQVALSQLYSVAERWSDLRALLSERRKRAGAPGEQIAILFQIADLDEGVLDNQDAAAADYQAILELDPSGAESTRAFRSLDRLLVAKERWTDLTTLLGSRVPYTEQNEDIAGTPDSRAHLRARQAELYLSRLDKPAEALELFEEVISDEPRHETARRGLETLMKRPELRLRVARLLEPLYEAEEAWPKLALCIGAQREASENRSGETALRLAVRLAELQEEKLGARQLALGTWREALRLGPGEKRVRDNVERLSTLLGRTAELAAAWEEALLVSDPGDLTLRAELLEKAAELYEHELRDAPKAEHAWRRLLELDPTNLQIARPAAAALSRLYEATESWAQLVDVLHRQADWTDALGDKKELLFRIARIQEELTTDPDAAISTYREVLEVDAEDIAALDSLERLHRARGQWVELVDVLRRRLDLEKDSNKRRDLLWRIAQIAERERKDATEAIAGYHAVLDERTDDMPALEALARLYEADQRKADLLEILERQLALAGKPPERVALRLRIAQLVAGFGRRDQALERYREVLEDEPGSAAARAGLEALLEDEDLRLKAAEVLEPIYQKANRLDAVAKLHELFAEHAPDTRERIGRLRRIAELRLAEPAEAFQALSRSARLAVGEPDLPEILSALEKLVDKRAPLGAELVTLYKDLGPEILDGTTQERVYLKVAAESRTLGDRDTAREYYRRVLDQSPEHEKSLDALESIYLEGRELSALFEIYARRADLAGVANDDDKRHHYLVQLASLCEGELDRPSEAVNAWQQVLEIFPNDVDAWRALDAQFTAQKRWADLADLVERRIGFADDLDEAVALRFRLAKVYEEELSDSDRAVENYRATLGGDPAHAGAIAALERFLDDENHRVSAAEVLESVYSSRHDWAKLARIHEIRLEASDDERVKLALTRRMARLYEEQLEDLEGAFRWFGKVFVNEPSDRAIRDQLARLAGILDSWRTLAGIYENFVDEHPDADAGTLTDVLRALASIYHTRLNDVDGAKAAYKKLLDADANDEVAFVSLERLLTAARRWQDLVEVWNDAADATLDMERKKTLLAKQAAVKETELSDRDAAISLWRSILDIDPDDSKAISALDRLYTDGQRWHDVLELTQRRLERADGPAWVSLKLRLGSLYENELADRAAAIDAYEEILGRTPGQPDAVRALERLIVDTDHTYRIAQILQPIYESADSWQKLVVIYDAQLDFVDDKMQRLQLLRDIAGIHEKRGGDIQLGFNALARAFGEWAEEGGDEETQLWGELARLAAEHNLWQPLEKTLVDVVDKSLDSDLQVRLWGRIAGVRERELKDTSAAIEAWRKVTAAKDDEGDAWKALERLLDAAGRGGELVAVLEKRASLAYDPVEQSGLLARAGALYEALGRREDAIGAWQRVLGIDDGDPAALDALERLYAQAGAHRDLAQIYSRKIEISPDEGTRRKLRFLLAGVVEKQLGDRQAAIEALRGVVMAGPDREALVELARLYEAETQWVDVVEVLDQLAAVPALSDDERARYRLRAANVVERELSDPEGAVPRYRDILPVVPEARAALEKLARQETTRSAATMVLEPYYLDRNEFAPLVEVYELRLAGESEPVERRALLARIAEVAEAGLEDMRAAFAAWSRVLGEDAGDEAAQTELERLAGVSQLWAELVQLYEERLSASFDPEAQRALAWKLGGLYEQRLGDDDKAIVAYQKALDLPGAEPDAPGGERACLQALDRLLSRAGRSADLAEVLQRQASLTLDNNEQATFYFRLGTVKLDALVDLDGALSAFSQTLERSPKNLGARTGLERLLPSKAHADAALDVLEPLFEDDEDHRKLLELGEVRLTLMTACDEQVALLERMAERAEKKLGDRATALAALERALTLDPGETRLADEVERIAGDSAGPTFERIASSIRADREIVRDLELRAARAYERAHDPRAERRYRQVLMLDGDHEEALRAVERLVRAGGDRTALAAALAERARVELDVSEKRALLAERAKLLHGLSAAPDEQIAAWRAVLSVEENDLDALDALATLFRGAGRYAELVETLEVQATHAETPATQLPIKREIAQLYAEALGDLDRAAAAWRDVLDVEPTSLPALSALEAVERRRGDLINVQEVLVRRLQAVGGGDAQIPVYLALAALAMEQKSPEDAIGYLHEILQLRPTHPEAVDKLLALLDETGKHHDLVDVLTTQANQRAQTGDTQGELALLVRAANVWEQRLGSPESATEILERILERDPRNVRALASLGQIYEAQHDLPRARETMERALALATTSKEQADVTFRLGKLAAEEGGEAAAEPWLRRVLELDPAHPGAGDALLGLARSAGRWDEVAALQAQRLPSEPAKQLTALVEIAQLYLTKLSQPKAALPFLEKARALAPDDPAVQEPLADLYFADNRLDEALPVYRALADRMQKARRMKDVARLRARIAAIAEARGDQKLALDEYLAAHQIDPAYAPTMTALAKLYMVAADWEKARGILRKMLLQNLDASAGVTKADVYLKLGEIHEKLNEGPKAAGMYERGLELDGKHAGLRAALSRLKGG